MHSFRFELKPEDRSEPSPSERPALRTVADPQSTLVELLALLRQNDGTLVQTGELLAESAALADPARLRRRAQDRVREVYADNADAIDLAERLARELRETGALSASYSPEGRR